MASVVHPSRANRPIDFFISYSPADERWATWLAWELETAGYRTMLQAWDFVAGTNFIDFMDRGVREAAVVVAVLSERYMRSTYGRLEWQAALRADPDGTGNKLVTIRIEDCPIDGLLATITFVDLVGVTDPVQARTRILDRIRQSLSGRAKPALQPVFPHSSSGPRTVVPVEPPVPGPPRRPRARRTPINPPPFPPTAEGRPVGKGTLSVLQVSGPRFGRGLIEPGAPVTPGELQENLTGELTTLFNDGVPRPDLIVVSGNLTETGSQKQFSDALAFLTGLRVLLGLEPNRLIVVPGPRDLTRAASRAYFATCEADDVDPQPPYWPKWRHYSRLFEELYQGLDEPIFDSEQSWTLFTVPELRVVVAGLNSTIADSHREDDHYGFLGEAQAAWFAQWLLTYRDAGWLRLGVMSHAPGARTPYTGKEDGSNRAEVLRDRASFNRLVGPMLNLLLSGVAPGHAPDDAVVPVSTVSQDGRAQLLTLTAEGMTQWVLGRDHRYETGEPTALSWTAASATFGATGPAQIPDQRRPVGEEPPGSTEPDMTGPDVNPADTDRPVHRLLDRLAEVCEARHDRVLVRRIDVELPHLFVTYRVDDVVRQQRVGAFVGTPGATDIDRFARRVHATDPDIPSELVYHGERVPRVLAEDAARRGIRVLHLTEFQGLLDLREYVANQTAWLQANRLYPPDLYVPQRYRYLVGADQQIRGDIVDELLRLCGAPDGRFTLVLGDFGRGKTFALREVARRLPTAAPELIPIFVELRTLDKAHSVDGLVAAHLANHGERLIDLKAFRFMLRQGRIVLLFDGFDELVARVTYDRAADHLETLLHAAEGSAKIIVSSRTQHFRTSSQVLTALGERVGLLPHRRVLTLEDFTPAQIQSFLRNRYGGDVRAARNRMQLLAGVGDLLGLSRNPRMLAFIADLDEQRLAAVARASATFSAAALYREILESWLEFEERRTRGVPGSPGALTIADLWTAVGQLAFLLWERGEAYLDPSELAEVADTLADIAESRLTGPQTAHAVGAGSLLIRTDEGLFGFIHNSVMEWLVADGIAGQLNESEDPPALHHRSLSQLTVEFLSDLAETRHCAEWASRILADDDSDETARANAVRISARLRLPDRADLRGAQLRGEDLSHRDLAGADLSTADLTEARLVATNLTEATLRRAQLRRSRLDRTRLTGADLSGADLGGARLLRADLRGARIAGSTWRRAALIDVAADPALLRRPELRAAVITPGRGVEPGLWPSSVGVSYGFEVGRLPAPVAYSPDGMLLAAGSDDGGVLICDTESGLPVRTLQGHRGRVYAVDYDVASHQLVTGSADLTIRFWDADHGDVRHVLDEPFQGWVWPMVVDPMRGRLAVGDATGTIRVYDTATAALQHEWSGHTVPVWHVAFSPDGQTLAVADSAGVVRAWDLADGQLRYQVSDEEVVYRLAFSPDGTRLVSVGQNGRVRIRQAVDGSQSHLLRGHEADVYGLDLSPDGELIATGDTHGTLRLWHPATGRPVRVLGRQRGAIYSVRFSGDGTLLVTSSSSGAVRLWDAHSGDPRLELVGHRGSVWPVVFRPDHAQIATSSNDGTTRLWDVRTGQTQHTLQGHGRRVTTVSFRDDSSTLATCGNDGVVRLWDPRTGRLVRRPEGTARFISAVFCPGQPRLAATSGDGGVHLLNSMTGKNERRLNVETDHVWAVAFSSNGDVLATANDDDTVQLWYHATGRKIGTLEPHRGRVRSVAFSPSGELIATGCDDRFIRIWDAGTTTCQSILEHHSDRVYSVVFDSDGSRLASASNDGTAAVWDVVTGERLLVLMGHTGRLWSAAFSPDGTVLATAGDDLVVRLWDAATGRLHGTLAAHTRRVWSVAYSPDGGTLASAGDDGTVQLWDVSDPEHAKPRATLIGLPDGWAAVSPDGRYKLDGASDGQFWHVIGTCRFEPGELDPYLTQVRRMPLDDPF